ncbi:MAG: BrnT family toxin [Anaerolineae bacterium]|nr:BrnT family toxin [Anaerolineae bacterium]
MRISGIIWLEDVVEKLEEKHDVRQHEARETLTGRPLFRRVEKGHRVGENVYSAFGQTDAGRYLIIFFIHKRDGRALILSARDMTRNERRRYERR